MGFLWQFDGDCCGGLGDKLELGDDDEMDRVDGDCGAGRMGPN